MCCYALEQARNYVSLEGEPDVDIVARYALVGAGDSVFKFS